MERDAIIGSHTVGIIEAYRQVISDISTVLEEPVIDMRKLFYAVMIQSGIKRFRVPEVHASDLTDSSLVSERLGTIDYAKVEPQLRDLRTLVVNNLRNRSRSRRQDEPPVSDLVCFLSDLYIAAEFHRPVATAALQPKLDDLQKVLKDDICIVIESLFAVVENVKLDAPVARFQVPVQDFASFREVMLSDVFDPYVESHALLELAYRPTARVVDQVNATARRVVDTFPINFDLRNTVIGAVQAMPAIVEASAGKVFGALAKPFFSAIEKAIGGNQRLLIYSFDPTWRQVWGKKLDKVRAIVEAEHARTTGRPRGILG